MEELTRQVAERTADLQRLQAEYTNYRRRVERDRDLIRETAVANVLTNLLPVLDDIGRARDHGELEGGFKSVAEGLESILETLGLVRVGEPGEPFDPVVHEAVTFSGIGAEISSQIQEVAFDYLDAPVLRIGAPFSPVPFSPVLEKAYIPDVARIEREVTQLLERAVV